WNVFGAAYLVHSYDLDFEKTKSWDTTAQAYYARQFNLTSLNLGFGEATTGPRFVLVPDQGSELSVRPFALANIVTLNDDVDFWTAGGGLELDKAFDADRVQLSGAYTNRYETYVNSVSSPNNSLFTGDTNTFGMNGSYDITNTIRLGLAGYVSVQNAQVNYN